MFCFVVYSKEGNKQLRVFPYEPLTRGDWERAQRKARAFADSQAASGAACIVERFAACDVGVLDYTTD